jgi:hypothetical protein
MTVRRLWLMAMSYELRIGHTEEVMRKRLYAAAAMSVLVATGCHYGAIEKDFGKSYTMAKQGQILNPDASKNMKPVTGLNAKAAEAAAKKYTDSFSGGDKTTQSSIAIVPVTPTGSGGTGQDVYGK